MWAFAFAVLTVSAPLAEDEANDLLKKARGNLSKATLVKIKFEGTVEAGGKERGKPSGHFTLSTKDRKLEAELTVGPYADRRDDPYRKSDSGDGFSDRANKVLEAIGIAGAFVPFFFLENWDEVKDRGLLFISPQQFEASNLRMGKKEKVGDREAQVVEYTLKDKDGIIVMENRMWIDLERNIPLKYSVTATRGKLKVTVNEVYERIETK